MSGIGSGDGLGNDAGFNNSFPVSHKVVFAFAGNRYMKKENSSYWLKVAYSEINRGKILNELGNVYNLGDIEKEEKLLATSKERSKSFKPSLRSSSRFSSPPPGPPKKFIPNSSVSLSPEPSEVRAYPKSASTSRSNHSKQINVPSIRVDSSDDRFFTVNGETCDFDDYNKWRDELKTKGEIQSDDKTIKLVGYLFLDEEFENKYANPFLETLDKIITMLGDDLLIVDMRDFEMGEKESNNLAKCINYVCGLHVGKVTEITTILESFYVILDGIVWEVQNIKRLSKRTNAELRMVQLEIYRRRPDHINDPLYNVYSFLKKTDNSDSTSTNLMIASVARCLEARITYSYTKHELNVEKYLLQARLDQYEGELLSLLSFLDSGLCS